MPSRSPVNSHVARTKIAVVTGASSGIGASVARRLSDDGFELILHGNRNLIGLQQIAGTLREQTRVIGCVVADLSRPSTATRLADTCWNMAGARLAEDSLSDPSSVIDAWIHCAGADVLTGAAQKASFEEKLEWLLQVDVRGTILACRSIATKMSDQSRTTRCTASATEDALVPAIITVGWDQAVNGFEGDSGQYFCPTKAAIMAFTLSLAKTCGRNVRVNCVAPGWVQTQWGQSAPDFWERRATHESIMGRWGKPRDVANAVAFLVSEQANFINGQILNVNGGWKPAWPETSL